MSLLVHESTLAQEVVDFKAQAAIAEVSKTDYYKIRIKPEIVPYINRDFSDLRIYNSKNEEVPFFIKKASKPEVQETFKSYPIVENKKLSNRTTSLVIHNQFKEELNEIHVQIKNADVEKRAWLLGSDDNINYYVVKDQFYLHSLNTPNETTIFKVMNFPSVDYEYVKLLISDSSSSPVLILDAGYYEYKSSSEEFQKVPISFYSQEDNSNDKSYLTIAFKGLQMINKLSFSIEGPEYYYRNAKIFTRKFVKIKKRKGEFQVSNIGNFKFKSAEKTKLILSPVYADTLFLEINNLDDKPLEIKNPVAFQRITYLCAKLKSDEEYVLTFGNPELGFPKYDIKHFKDTIDNNLSTIEIGEIKEFERTVKKSNTGMTKKWIWVFLFVVLGFLLVLSVRLVKEMNNRKD